MYSKKLIILKDVLSVCSYNYYAYLKNNKICKLKKSPLINLTFESFYIRFTAFSTTNWPQTNFKYLAL